MLINHMNYLLILLTSLLLISCVRSGNDSANKDPNPIVDSGIGSGNDGVVDSGGEYYINDLQLK